jgi:hypothetical protein
VDTAFFRDKQFNPPILPADDFHRMHAGAYFKAGGHMLASGNPMFLMIPNASNSKELHPGTVLVADSKTYEADFDEAITLDVGADVNAYGEVRGKFFQQGARVTAIREEGDRKIFVFDRVGEVVSAEQRQTYRVSSVTTGIVARIGKEERCPVVDVSPEGFGAIVAQRCEVGSLITVLLRFWNEDLTAAVRVQTCQARPDGKFRFGFLAPEKNSPARKALQKISATLQRAQLSRLSGAA